MLGENAFFVLRPMSALNVDAMDEEKLDYQPRHTEFWGERVIFRGFCCESGENVVPLR